MTYDDFFQVIVQQIPSFAATYEEHLADNGELLNHVLMGDFMRFVVQLYKEDRLSRGRNEGVVADLRTALRLLEEGMGSRDERLQELISVSFLENLHQAEEAYDGIRGLFGPRLLKELADHYE